MPLVTKCREIELKFDTLLSCVLCVGTQLISSLESFRVILYALMIHNFKKNKKRLAQYSVSQDKILFHQITGITDLLLYSNLLQWTKSAPKPFKYFLFVFQYNLCLSSEMFA